MFNWVKKLFVEEPKPTKEPTTMVAVLKELWDIDQKKEVEHPPPNVNTDIYAVESRDRTVPRRSRSRRQRYNKA